MYHILLQKDTKSFFLCTCREKLFSFEGLKCGPCKLINIIYYTSQQFNLYSVSCTYSKHCYIVGINNHLHAYQIFHSHSFLVMLSSLCNKYAFCSHIIILMDNWTLLFKVLLFHKYFMFS